MNKLNIYNSMSKKIEEFVPLNAGEVTMYSCGPTVYDYPHMGNLRAFVVADILKRTLIYNGFQVKHTMNITDVGHLTGDRDLGEDKLELRAETSRQSAQAIAEKYTKAFIEDIGDLNIMTPQFLPKATDHIKEMIELIKLLEERGYTYLISDGVYMDTSKVKDYGKLATVDIEQLREGARVEKSAEKLNPTDFALWKFSPKEKKRDMEWDSPWGIGFPGWHIECSAMSTKYLGQPMDIHTGGVDHINVHHTNEIAQSESAHDTELARYWVHNEFLITDSGKMSKSKGRMFTLNDVKAEGVVPLAVRYMFLQSHYRGEMKFSLETLISAQEAYNHLREMVSSLGSATIQNEEYITKFRELINNDMATPEVVALMWKLLKDENIALGEKMATLLEMDKVLGLKLEDGVISQELRTEIEEKIKARDMARSEKDFAKADEIRLEIDGMGFKLEDTDGETIIKRKY